MNGMEEEGSCECKKKKKRRRASKIEKRVFQLKRKKKVAVNGEN